MKPIDSLTRAIDAFVGGSYADPFALLGPHPVDTKEGRGWAIRFFEPHATAARIILAGDTRPVAARKVRPEGLFEATLPTPSVNPPVPASYRIQTRATRGEVI